VDENRPWKTPFFSQQPRLFLLPNPLPAMNGANDLNRFFLAQQDDYERA
jgi:hypothetical protein